MANNDGRPEAWVTWNEAVQRAWQHLQIAQSETAGAVTRLRRYLGARDDALLLEIDARYATEALAATALLAAQVVQRYPELTELVEWLLSGADNGEPEPQRRLLR